MKLTVLANQITSLWIDLLSLKTLMQLLVVMIFYSAESKLFLNDLKHQVHSSFLLTATILILLLADNVSTSFSAPKNISSCFSFPG